MRRSLLTSFAAVITTAALVQPVLAVPNAEIIRKAYTAPAYEKYELDEPFSDVTAANYAFQAYVYHEKPEIFLSCADFSGANLGLQYYYASREDHRITDVSFTDGLLEVWNSETYADNFWTYVDSVITAAGVFDLDSISSKVRKTAIFIGQNYRHDYNTSSEAFFNQDIPFFESLTENQVSFCMVDARLFMACCIRMGIPCTYIEGDASGLHSWNRVYVDGTWREVDVSFARKAKNKDRYILFDSGREIFTEVG